MAFLTVAGITALVREGTFRKLAPRGMTDTETFAFGTRTVGPGDLFDFAATVGPVPEATAVTLEAAIANGAHVACAGDVLGSYAGTFRVRQGECEYYKDGLVWYRDVPLTLVRVAI